MNDLLTSSVILGSLSLLAFASGLWLGRHGTSRQRIIGEVLGGILLWGYLGLIWNRPLLTWIIPGSGLIILANWLPFWGSFFVGIYATSDRIARVRKAVVTTVTLGLVVYSGIAPMLGDAPECRPVATHSDLLPQTTPYTCSPAAAASMLRLHGIVATEAEMAKLCLTRRGTHWMGLYRGLKLKTAGTPWSVSVEPYSTERLEQGENRPCILSINVDPDSFDPHVDHGFIDAHGHSVVFLQRKAPEQVIVFDPSPDFGVEVWDTRILNSVTSGIILRLVPAPQRAADIVAVRNRSRRLAYPVLTASLDTSIQTTGLRNDVR